MSVTLGFRGAVGGRRVGGVGEGGGRKSEIKVQLSALKVKCPYDGDVGTPDRQAWLATLDELRQRLATAKTGLTVEQILDEDRGD